MTKYERAKLWAKEHQDQLVVVGVGAAIVGILVVVVKADMKYQHRALTELNEHIDQLNELVRLGELDLNPLLMDQLAA